MLPKKQSFPAGYFDADRHPRGYSGRFTATGGSSQAHAMRTIRTTPDPSRRRHAVVPHIKTPRSVVVRGTGGIVVGE